MDIKMENIRKRDAGLLPELQKVGVSDNHEHI